MERLSRMIKKIEIDENINELSLKQRKQIVNDILENCKDLNIIVLKKLLKYNNTNEKLIVKYIYSLTDEEAKIKLMEYSCFISVNNIKQIENQKFKNNLGNRKISFKSLLMSLLFELENIDKTAFYNKINIINYAINKKTVINNQPYDKDNYESLYFYICTLFSTQVEKNKNKIEEYLKNLKRLTSTFEQLKKYYNNNNNKEIKNEYEEEDKDFNKFLIVILVNFLRIICPR